MRRFYMRFFLKLLFVFLVIQHLPGRVHAQTITFRGAHVQLSEVFSEIFTQTGHVVTGDAALLQGVAPVTVSVHEMPLSEFLNLVLSPRGLQARIEAETIILQKNPTMKGVIQTRPDSLVLVRGKVVDEAGNPLSGVSIRLEGSPRDQGGAGQLSEPRVFRTNEAGQFNILCLYGNTLLFTHLGFQPTTVVVSREGFNGIVTLHQAEQQLAETVVTGIFTRKTESFTGAAQTFSKEQLLQVGNANVLQSLKNLDPSFHIVQDLAAGSDPNALPTIQMRGQSGFPDLRGDYQTDPNQPLFILDGFEATLTRVLDLDMNRVESVTILKDAAAKTIYGSKAANGVVVIETERPKEGKVRLSYVGNLTVSAPDLSSYNLTNASQKLDVEKAAGLYTAFNGNPVDQFLYTQEYNRLLEDVLKGVNTDWLSKPVRTGIGHKHTIRAEGGTRELRYGLDLSLNRQDGVMRGSARNTAFGSVDLMYRTRKIAMRNELSITHNRGINSPLGSFSAFAAMNPYFRHTDEQGRIQPVAGQTLVTGVVANPLWNEMIHTKDDSYYFQMANNFYLDWFVNDKWKITARSSIQRQENGDEVFLPASHTSFLSYTTEELVKRRGRYNYTDGLDAAISGDLLSAYSTTVGRHLIFVNTIWSIYQSSIRSVAVSAEGFPNDYLDDITFARQFTENSRPSGMESTVRNAGGLVAANYAYDNRYLVDASFRLDGSSQFGSDNRWGQFWSAGLGWNIHRERFAADWTWMDQFRIRGSVGYSGSQNFNSYQSRTTFSYNTGDTYLGDFGAYLLAMGNRHLKWQRKFDQNVGLDLSFDNRRMVVKLDVYESTTNDLLTDVSLPTSTGFRSYRENLGEVQNRGYEFNINYRIWRDTRNSFVNIFVGGAHNRNRISRISNSLQSLNDAATEVRTNRPVVRFTEGQSMNAIWAVPSYGIDPMSGEDIYGTPDGGISFTWSPDFLRPVGTTEPTLRGNAGLNMGYRGWNLNLGINWMFGGQIYNQTLVDKVENANPVFNVDARMFSDRWRTQGDEVWFKGQLGRIAGLTRATQRFVMDQDELTFSSLSLSYDLDRHSFIQRYALERVRLMFFMNDLGTLSSVRLERGTAYPFARNISFSIQTVF